MASEDLFSKKLKRLDVRINGVEAGALTKESNFTFSYVREGAYQPGVSLLMPPTQMVYNEVDLFPSMDMNLPEGYLFHAIREMHPKISLTKMHYLALMGDNAIGRVGFVVPGEQPGTPSKLMSRKQLLSTPVTDEVFRDLVAAYLSSGAGISGVQPKIMVPTRGAMPIPDLIVKTAGADYPGLAGNEYLCLLAAMHAGIDVPKVDLSDDGKLLVVDRFDIAEDHSRIGFEDIAALMGLHVFDRLDNRKYQGSYQYVAEVIANFATEPAQALNVFYNQLVMSIMVRNGDAHLKNFGMLYDGRGDINRRLSPLYDVVTTSIYERERPDGSVTTDRTMALKLFAGKHGTNTYPTTKELERFGREYCRVDRPMEVIVRVADGMSKAMQQGIGDPRLDQTMVESMRQQWSIGQTMASERS